MTSTISVEVTPERRQDILDAAITAVLVRNQPTANLMQADRHEVKAVFLSTPMAVLMAKIRLAATGTGVTVEGFSPTSLKIVYPYPWRPRELRLTGGLLLLGPLSG